MNILELSLPQNRCQTTQSCEPEAYGQNLQRELQQHENVEDDAQGLNYGEYYGHPGGLLYADEDDSGEKGHQDQSRRHLWRAEKGVKVARKAQGYGAAPITPLKLISQPMTKARNRPKAWAVYSYSALALGNMEDSSA